MTLLIMLLTTATAWAEDNVPYLDPTAPVGQQSKTQDNVTVLTGNEITSDNSPLQGGWYIVKGTINYSSTLYFDGDVKLILENGCNMNIGTENSPITSRPGGITASSSADCTFTIYGQSGNTGNLNLNIADESGYWVSGISAYAAEDNHYSIIVNGGNIYINAAGNGIDTDGDFTINGGSITVNVDGAGIYADQNMAINGGSIGVTGCIMAGEEIRIKDGEINVSVPYGKSISAEYVTIEGGTVTVNSDEEEYGIYAYKNIIIKDGTVTVSKDGEQADDAEEAIHAEGTINITGGTVVANGYYWGIYAKGNITIDCGNITATATDSGYAGIYTEDGDINITNGTIEASGGDDGILASGDIIIDDGTIIANGGERGLYASGIITIKDGSVTATGGDYGNIRAVGINIYGGTINATGSDYGLYSQSDNGFITINGGTVNISDNTVGIRGKMVAINDGIVNATNISSYGIYTESITINGGNVNATGGVNGISASKTLLAGGIVKANSYEGKLTIADNFTYTDGTTLYNPGYELTEDEVDALNSANPAKTLQPSSVNLTANLVDGYYWSTFYFGSLDFTIVGNAYAYTATYGLNSDTNKYEITLHTLGKNIPQGTAVIIVSSDESVSLSKADNLGKFSGSNDLRGVDVATSLTSVLDTYKANALLMLSNKNGKFGFHDVVLTNVPARKAFLPIDDPDPNPVRSFNIVFEDDDTTGINAVNNEERIGNDAWYDLQGRKIQMPTQRGLYIHNGKKIVVK